MKSYLTLVKIGLRTMLNPSKLAQRKNGSTSASKAALFSLLYFVIIVYFTGISFVFFNGICSFADGANAVIAPMLAYLFCTFLALLTAAISTQGWLFKAKDLDLLLSLPVKHSTVLLSKITMLYIYEMIFVLIINIPACVAYFLHSPITAFGIISAVLSTLTLPLLPMTIGMLIAFGLGLITRKFKKRNFFTTVFTLLFTCGLVIGMQYVNNIVDNPELIQNGLKNIFDKIFLVRWTGEAISGSIIKALFMLLLGVVPAALTVLPVSKKYSQLIGVYNSTNSGRKKDYKKTKRTSVFLALLKKEYSFFFSSSQYVMNTVAGAVLALVLIIFFVIFRADALKLFLNESNADFATLLPSVTAIATLFLVFMSCLNPPTTCSISLEGKRLWIYRSLPVDVKTVFNSKLLMAFSIFIPFTLLSSIILTFAFSLSFLDFLGMTAVPLFASAFTTVCGLFVNLLLPKLDYINEIQVIKQSASVFVMILFSFATIIPIALLYFLAPLSFALSSLILCALLLLLTVLAYTLLMKKGVKRFENLVY